MAPARVRVGAATATATATETGTGAATETKTETETDTETGAATETDTDTETATETETETDTATETETATATGEPPPDVIPLVVYAGKRRWTAPRDLAGLLAPINEPALHALRPRFAYLLDDLTQLTPGMLRARALGPLGQLALVTLCAVQRGGLHAALGDLLPLVRGLSSVHDGPEELTVLLRYLVTVVPAPEQPAVQALVAALPSHEQ